MYGDRKTPAYRQLCCRNPATGHGNLKLEFRRLIEGATINRV
jgi:hypothetical protein